MVKQVQADEHVLDDRKVEVKIAVPKEKMGHSGGGAGPGMRKVFVGGLSVDTDDAAFTDYFGAYGAIEESTIMRDSQCSHFPLRPSVLSSCPRVGHFATRRTLLCSAALAEPQFGPGLSGKSRCFGFITWVEEVRQPLDAPRHGAIAFLRSARARVFARVDRARCLAK